MTLNNRNAIVGYYSLVYSAIDQKLLPAEVVKGLGKYDIPVMLLARLATDTREQGRGLGKALLKDAIERTIQAVGIAGLKFLLVHAKDDSAAAFYTKHGFSAFTTKPLTLYLPVKLSP